MRDFLSECYRIENLSAKAYRKFSDNPGYSETVRNMFRTMADEEMEHARIIDLVMQTPEYELDATPGLSPGEVDEMLRMAKALLACAEQSELSAKEALQLALQIEEQLVQIHANNALIPGSRKLDEFFTNLARYDRAHVDQLRSCIGA